jgi:hypothetical protein
VSFSVPALADFFPFVISNHFIRSSSWS